jgi:hypothetical protein
MDRKDSHILATKRADARGTPVPPSPHPLPLGPRSVVQAATSSVSSGEFAPWAVIVVIHRQLWVSPSPAARWLVATVAPLQGVAAVSWRWS